MSKRALIIILSVVVIGISLAGLQGILNLLAKRGPLDSTDSRQPVAVEGQTTPIKTTTPLTPNIEKPPTVEFPFEITPLNNLAKSFPSLDIAPAGGLPAHLPLFKVEGTLGSPYLRSTAASVYQNQMWMYDTSVSATKYKGEKLDFAITGYSSKALTNIEISPLSKFASTKMPIPVGQYVNKLNSSFPVSYDSKNSIFVSDTGLPGTYTFESIQYGFSEESLIKAKINPDQQYLQLPKDINPQTIDLAKSLTENIQSPYLKARAIEEYLKENYTYDFNFRPAPDGQDPNEWFLFEEPKGVCTNFNSAFVMLARTAGIPARLVGGYDIDPQSNSQVVYADQAHAWSEIKLDQPGWVTLDATGANQTPLVDTVTEITKAEPKVEKNSEFSVAGTVKAEGATTDGVLVELYINHTKTTVNGTLIGQALVKNNIFEIAAKVPTTSSVGNYQLIAKASQTPKFTESTSDPVIKVMSKTALSLSIVPKIKTGQLVTINGLLAETGKLVLSGQKVEILLNGKLLTGVITDSKGKFEYQTSFSQSGKYDLKAAYKGDEFYFPCEQSSSFQVLIPTILTIQAPTKIKTGQTFKIEGFLKTSSDSKPIVNQYVELSINDKTTGIKAKTDTNGHFILENKIKSAGISQIDVKYLSQPYYWDASTSAVVEVAAANDKTVLGVVLMLSGLILASGYVGFRYWRKHKPIFKKKNKEGEAPVSVEEAPTLVEAAPEPSRARVECGIQLDIDFPGIIPPLPDIWGLGDDFDVACRLVDAEGKPLAGKEIEISMGSPITTLTTDNDGKASVTLSFSEKGFFEVEATYRLQNNQGEEIIQAAKVIRIVDYREEIIEEYKSVLDWFKKKEVAISRDNTPREAENSILKSGLPVSTDSIETIIACFEEATYSLHPINRQNYVKMHFAQEEIKEDEKLPELAPE